MGRPHHRALEQKAAGYTMEWDGVYKSTRDAQLSLLPGMALLGAMSLVVIMIKNSIVLLD